MTKNEREQVRTKFDGRCAYCGVNLGPKFHVDHVHPKFRGGDDCLSNYFPACTRCNLWKKTYTIEEFRNEIEMQIERLRKRVPGFRLAEDFGLIGKSGKEIRFWFEEYAQ